MKSKKETFADLMQPFQYKYDLWPVFDDFLTMSICACSPNPLTGKSHLEDLYMETIAKYKDDDLRHQFPKLFACLVNEMEERGMDSGNDVLGEYFEQNLSRKNSGQFFTPWPICELMAQATCGSHEKRDEPYRTIDPTCGSGRMLVAGAKHLGREHEFYGIDIDHTCVKMAVINLFLNGIFHAEVMCADALLPGNFRVSYRISFLPFGIFRIQEKEHSPLWNMYRNSFPVKPPKLSAEDLTLSQAGSMQAGPQQASQLNLF